MTNDKFKSTELRGNLEAVFINGDDSSANKNLTDERVAENALNAVFRDRPAYFQSPSEKDLVR